MTHFFGLLHQEKESMLKDDSKSDLGKQFLGFWISELPLELNIFLGLLSLSRK